MPAEIIKSGTFRDGFEAGYRTIRGTMPALPAIPAAPATPAGSTPFLMGIRRGIERALGKDLD